MIHDIIEAKATISTLNMVFYTPGGPERFVEFCWFILVAPAARYLLAPASCDLGLA